MKLVLAALALVSASAFAASPSQTLTCTNGYLKFDIAWTGAVTATVIESAASTDRNNPWSEVCSMPNGADVTTTPQGYEFNGYFYCVNGDQGASTLKFDSSIMTMSEPGYSYSCLWN